MKNPASSIVWFEDIGRTDVSRVGGKNASLGELFRTLQRQGVAVTNGFATTAAAYWEFVDANHLREEMSAALDAFKTGKSSLTETGARIRAAFLHGDFPPAVAADLRRSYAQLSQRYGVDAADVAVRSSATAEDLPDASFAGQQESFLNVCGEQALLNACRRCYASLFTDRAISYRQAKGFDHFAVALSIGVQKMVRSDLAGSGVMFSIDTESGCDRVVVINAAFGLGESVVQGNVDPDEYMVFKPLLADTTVRPIVEMSCGSKEWKLIYAASHEGATRYVATSRAERERFVLTETEVLRLARWACLIEQHYGMPMDMEWAKDGQSGDLFVVQARPETVHANRKHGVLKTYSIAKKGARLTRGVSVGAAAVSGRTCLIENARDIGKFKDGAILVTGNTDPDWVPIMKRARALITDHGGRTSHAAIVSRELGLPAVIGTGDATRVLHDGQDVTVSCAEGEQGFVYDGQADITVNDLALADIPQTRTQVMLNLANPAAVLRWWELPADGVGLARMEFVVSTLIRVHPMALVHFDALTNAEDRKAIEELTRGYEDRTEYFVDRLARGLARIAAVQYPHPVIIRTSDFKTNEYANLIGGRDFEPPEENPMIGLRGASRYYSPRYRDAFVLECRALRRLRTELGFRNVVVMIPFCRSLAEADQVLEIMAANGLKRGAEGLQVYMMCEIPSNVILARQFAQRFDGFSIGSNDLTQLTLGVDRDSEELAALFNEQDEAVRWMIRHVIAEAHQCGTKVGLCGQAPSDHPEFAAFLVECGIDSLSVSPDSFVAVKRCVAQAENPTNNPGVRS